MTGLTETASEQPQSVQSPVIAPLSPPGIEERHRIVRCALLNDHLMMWASLAAMLGIIFGDLIAQKYATKWGFETLHITLDGWAATIIIVVFCVNAIRSVMTFGCYIFGAKWDNEAFMKAVAQIVPSQNLKGN